MKRRLFTGLAALALLLSLPACAGQNPPQTETTPPPETTPAQAETAPPPSEELGFQVLPVTEEGIRTLYGWEGFEVRKITPWEGDFLVECGYANDPGFSLLYWVFGATGRRVQLTAMDQFASYEVVATGQVRCATTGQSGWASTGARQIMPIMARARLPMAMIPSSNFSPRPKRLPRMRSMAPSAIKTTMR